MIKAFAIIAGLVVVGGAVYVGSRPAPVDPQVAALSEALALHARALKTAVAEECAEARDKLENWRLLREAGSPSAEDNKKARKVLRQMVRTGCRGHG